MRCVRLWAQELHGGAHFPPGDSPALAVLGEPGCLQSHHVQDADVGVPRHGHALAHAKESL